MIDLTTPRLRLHLLTAEEARRVVDAEAGPDDRWSADFPMQDDRDGVGAFLKAVAAGNDPGTFGVFRIDDLDGPGEGGEGGDLDGNGGGDGTAIGTIGFFGPPDADGHVMFGYGLVPGARGAGRATEAVVRLVEFCRGNPAVRAMIADTLKDNVPSQRVLVKAGFEFVREDDELFYYRLDVAF